MRVTNKMMTNNMMYNIGNNKKAMSKVEDQYATGMKIQRPSEDPIITVRALKLRTNLSELNQYYERNIPDALSWMDVSESALKVVNDIITQVHTYCVQGANDTLKEEDRNSIVKTLTEMKEQINQEGNANYAGRYVFTGYKTDTSLVFSEFTKNLRYQMTEPLAGSAIDIIKRPLNDCDITTYDPENPSDFSFENQPNIVSAYRMRLAYDNLRTEEDGAELAIHYPVLDEKGRYTYDDDGVLITDEYTGSITHMKSHDAGAFEPDDDEIYFLEDTGELILGKNVYLEMKDLPEIRFTYEKEEFSKNDLRPEHYFDCSVENLNEEEDEREPIVYTKQRQEIQYEVNFGQKLVINTEGSDAVKHSLGRAIDDITNAIQDVTNTQNKMNEITKMLSDASITSEQETKLNEMLEVLKTEYTIKTEVMQTSYERGITEMQNQQKILNVAVADLGSRYVRLELTESRLNVEQTDFEELLSTNEDADLVDTIIKFKSQETVYNASLSAASKVVKNSLLDFL